MKDSPSGEAVVRNTMSIKINNDMPLWECSNCGHKEWRWRSLPPLTCCRVCVGEDYPPKAKPEEKKDSYDVLLVKTFDILKADAGIA